MAEGLLQQQSRGKKKMAEEIGDQYFQELVSRSLFQQSSGNKSRFVMHDLINDLAVDVAGEIYCNLERTMAMGDDEKIEKAHHLSFIQHRFEFFKRFTFLDKLSKHLRTFLPLAAVNGLFYLSDGVLQDFLPSLKRLRVLSLCKYQISKLPDSFENLKHVRYIDLSGTRIKCIPESVGSLLFSQTLLLSDCDKLTQLPTTIGNLIDLHHLDISKTPNLEEMPSGIGNLKNLLTLSKFIVGKASGMMRLSDLKNLSQLRGRLCILDLQNVSDVQDASDANLGKIQGLEKLVLEWTTSDNDGDELVLEMQVLNWLKPHSNLKNLKISCYGGESFPDWVCDPILFSNLSSMKLSNCKRCTLLPSLGQLPFLKKLTIRGMEAIEAVGPEFYGGRNSFQKLETLAFYNMSNWKEWTSPAESEGGFPCLGWLVIYNCPKLKEFSCLSVNISLPSLKRLLVENSNMPYQLRDTSHPSLNVGNGMVLKNMVGLTSLTWLTLRGISKLTCLPKSFTVSLTALETLEISLWPDLTCLWEEGAAIEQSLLPFNLKHLSLGECGALKSLPDAMMVQMDGSSSSNTSMLMLRLETLNIYGCHSLKSFPRGKLPITLKHLSIADCDGLESLPDADGDKNSNLHLKIKNLPRLCSSQSQLLAFLKSFIVEGCAGCGEFESFPENSLKFIKILGASKLKSLPSLDCVSNLVDLKIIGCDALESLPELGLCTPNLKQLFMLWCGSLKSLPNTMYLLKSLQKLQVVSCSGIEFFPDGGLPPNLTYLRLEKLENLKSLPNTMYQLKSLQTLWMDDCPRIEFFPDRGLPPNLTDLDLTKCKNLKSVPNTTYQLTSLQRLTIPGGALAMGSGRGLQNLKSLQELTIYDTLPQDIVLPSSLTSLFIENEENLESIPRELFQNLNSLEKLGLDHCSKLQSLPREGFPPSLGSLLIECPLLKPQRFEENGDCWALTRIIPQVVIREVSEERSRMSLRMIYGASEPDSYNQLLRTSCFPF